MHGTTEFLEQRGHDRTAHASHTVQPHHEPALPNPFDVNHREVEYLIDMALVGRVVRDGCPDAVPGGPFQTAGFIRECLQGCRRLRVEKQPVRADEFERIPLYGVVTRRQNDSAARFVMLHGELDGGRRDQAAFDHVAPDRLQPGPGGRKQHGA